MQSTIDEINMSEEQFDTLCEKKLKIAQADYRISNAVLAITEKIIDSLSEEERKIFNRSVVTPQCRRRDKAANAILFWQDKTMVFDWLTSRHRSTQSESAK